MNTTKRQRTTFLVTGRVSKNENLHRTFAANLMGDVDHLERQVTDLQARNTELVEKNRAAILTIAEQQQQILKLTEEGQLGRDLIHMVVLDGNIARVSDDPDPRHKLRAFIDECIRLQGEVKAYGERIEQQREQMRSLARRQRGRTV